MTQPRSLALPLATVLVALAVQAPFLLKPLRPWWDESRLLQAAVRHARGEGLTYTARPADDLTRAAYQPLAHWPPLYPLALSGLLRLGLPLEAAAKGVNAAALVLGVVGWLVLAQRFLTGLASRCQFAGLLVFAGGATDLAGYTTDFLLWAAMPYWFDLMLRARGASRAGWAWAGVAAVLVALLIGLRWAAAFLVPAGAAALLWPGARPESWPHRLARATAYGLPGALAYAALNRWGGYTSGMAFTPKWEFQNLLTLYPFESLFSAPLGLRPVLARAGRALDAEAIGLALRVGVPVVLLALLLVGARSVSEGKGPLADAAGSARTRELGLLLGLSFAALFALLSYLAVRYRPDTLADWSYLAQPRYFQPLHPAAALFWLMVIGATGHRLARAALAVVGVCLACLVLGEARGQYFRARAPDESWELVEKVRSLEARGGLQVLVSESVSDFVTTAGSGLVLIETADYARAPTTATRPAELWVVGGPAVERAGVTGLDTLVDRFGLRRAWASGQGDYRLYHARVGPPAPCPTRDPSGDEQPAGD
jgi:hypothetical protein